MKRIALFFCLAFLVSCSKEIKDGPYIFFSNDSSIPDTIAADETIPFEITAQGNAYKITRAQMFINKTEYFDTSFSARDTFSTTWEMDFSGRTRTQNVMIQVTDENDMTATQTKKIFIK